MEGDPAASRALTPRDSSVSRTSDFRQKRSFLHVLAAQPMHVTQVGGRCGDVVRPRRGNQSASDAVLWLSLKGWLAL
jgi:hypothetical protein